MNLYDKIKVGFGPGFGRKALKLFSLKPVDGSGDFSVVRANDTATEIGSDKLIKTVLANVPRADFGDFNCNTLLTEPQSTNLALWSEDFSNVSWGKIRNTITPESIIAPDGTLIADASIATSVSGDHRTQQTITVTATNSYTLSAYVKAGGKNTAYLVMEQTSPGVNDTAYFDLSTGLVGSLGANLNNSEIEGLPNGWYKISVTKNSATGGAQHFHVCFADSDLVPAFLGDDVTIDGYIWGVHLEQLPYPTSYIKTEGATVTRPQDVVSDGGDVNSIDSTKGIVFCHASAIDSSGNKEITLSDGSEPNAVTVDFSVSGITVTVKIAGVSNGVIASVVEVTDFNKIAYGYEDSNFVLWVNGLKVGETIVGSVFSAGVLDRLNLDAGDGTTPFNGKTKELWYSDDLSIDLAGYTGFEDWNDLVNNFKYNSQ